MILSQQTLKFLGESFRAGNRFYIPGPNTGIDIVRHWQAMRDWLKDYESKNPGNDSNDVFRREVKLYIAELEDVSGAILVLEILPMATLAAFLKEVEDEKDE